MRRTSMMMAVVLFWALGAGAALGQSGYDLFQQALVKERAEGNLEQAIGLYKRIVQEHAANRALAAKALVEMGQCYEKLGRAEAEKAYQRVLRDYADQGEQVSIARARLATLTQPASMTTASGMAIRRVAAGDTVQNLYGAVSPDGRYFSYRELSTRDLAIRDLVTEETYRINNGPGPWGPVGYSTFSPDGKQVAYAWPNPPERLVELRIIRFEGRHAEGSDGPQPRVLYSSRGREVIRLRPDQWSPDGKYILARFQQTDGTWQIVLVSVADGSVRVLKTLDWRYPLKMSFSPDGRYIAYDFPPKEDSPARDIFVLAIDGTREIPLVEHLADDRLLGWAPDGERILFSSDRAGSIDAWMVQVGEGKAQGSPTLIKRDIGEVRPMGFTRKGAFYYALLTESYNLYIATLDPETGKVLVPPSRAPARASVANTRPAWSADGQYLAHLSLHGPLPGARSPHFIVIRSLKTGEEREISPKLNYLQAHILRWSPDGKYFLVSGADEKNRQGLFQIDAKTGDATPIVYDKGEEASNGWWSPDGKAIFYAYNDFGSEFRGGRIVRRDLETGQEKELYRAVSPAGVLPARVSQLNISPDGRWLAFDLGERPLGRRQSMIMPVRGGEARQLQLPIPQDNQAVSFLTGGWTPDSRYVLVLEAPKGYQDVERELWRIPVEGGEPQKLGLATERMSYDHSVHPDGRRIAFSTFWPKHELWVMENFLPVLKAAK